MAISSAEISTMKNNAYIFRPVIPILIFALISSAALAQAPGAGAAKDRMPITTSSPEARALFEEGVVAWENLHISRALQNWQSAIEKDPNFLLAHLYISERIPDPGQQ